MKNDWLLTDEEIQKVLFHLASGWSNDFRAIAQAQLDKLLNLCYPNGNKMIAVLDEEQELPPNLHKGEFTRLGYRWGQQDMLTPKDEIVWKKVIE